MERRRFTIPVSTDVDRWVTVDAPVPLAPDEWARLMDILDVMKPGLVERPRADAAPEGER